MTGELLALGASHKTASLELRERLALPEGRAGRALEELVSHEAIHEAVALFTCNRTELYLVAADAVEAENVALSVLSRQAGIRPTELLASIYALRGPESVRHLFSVASGLDSMIVGEAEIQGQVKRAYELALVAGVTGPVSNRLFRDALAAGKRSRSETGISRSRVSISSVAVSLAAEFLGGDLASRRVLVIGAGENAELAARALRDNGVSTVFIANRRYDRALGLAKRFDGQAVSFEELPDELEQADIVVSSTGAPHQILGREELEVVAAQAPRAAARADRPGGAARHRPRRGGLPGHSALRHGRPSAGGRPQHRRPRDRGRPRAGDRRRGGRALRGLAEEPGRGADDLGAARARRAGGGPRRARERGPLRDLSEADRERLRAMARAVVSRLLHEPTLRLKDSVGEEASYRYVHTLRELFDLEPEREDDAPAAEVTPLDSLRRRRRSS